MSIVFIHIGKNLPNYLNIALAQARRFNQCDIILVASSDAVRQSAVDKKLNIRIVTCESLGMSEKQHQFHRLTRMDRQFRNGFWIHTTERFYYIETLMKKMNLQDIFHLENDNMLYADLQTLLPVFQLHYPGIAATFDAPNRCVPGFVYIKNSRAIERFTGFANDFFARNAAQCNDMTLLAIFRKAIGSPYVGLLPIVTTCYPHPLKSRIGCDFQQLADYAPLFGEFNSIFDAAAIGQYLGGVDPENSGGKNTVGFINETCVFDPSFYQYHWVTDPQQRRIPFLANGNRAYRINNLHIHSKALHLFAS